MNRSIAVIASIAMFAALGLGSSAEAQTSDFGRAGPWKVLTEAEVPGSCRALMTNDSLEPDFGRLFGIVLNGSKWELWTDYRIDSESETSILVDGKSFPATFNQMENVAVAPVKRNLIDALKTARSVNLNLDPTGPEYRLKSTAAAIKLVQDCVRSSSATAAAPEPSPQTHVGIGWAPGRAGKPIDRRAVAVGTMPDGMEVFVCVAKIKGGLHPGMTGGWIDGCSTGYGGNEVTSRDYLVMTGDGRWERAADGQVPNAALQVGNEADGTVLFVCRVKYQGAVFAGKVRPGFDGCHIPDGGQERSFSTYSVLVP